MAQYFFFDGHYWEFPVFCPVLWGALFILNFFPKAAWWQHIDKKFCTKFLEIFKLIALFVLFLNFDQLTVYNCFVPIETAALLSIDSFSPISNLQCDPTYGYNQTNFPVDVQSTISELCDVSNNFSTTILDYVNALIALEALTFIYFWVFASSALDFDIKWRGWTSVATVTLNGAMWAIMEMFSVVVYNGGVRCELDIYVLTRVFAEVYFFLGWAMLARMVFPNWRPSAGSVHPEDTELGLKTGRMPKET